MSLMLDQRQRAMLRDMGVRVWLPRGLAAAQTPALIDVPGAATATEADARVVTAPEDTAHATVSIAARAASTPPTALLDTQKQRLTPTNPSAPPLSAPAAPATAGAEAWQLGPAQPLYAEHAQPDGRRWLVLVQTHAAGPHGAWVNPLDDDAGSLLRNMLQAARLHQGPLVWLASLARLSPGPAPAKLHAALGEMLAELQPDVLLVMGRLAAQALLQSTLPLSQLRGQVHALHGTSAVVSCEPYYLLTHPADKAKAWEDLCLAMGVAAGAEA